MTVLTLTAATLLFAGCRFDGSDGENPEEGEIPFFTKAEELFVPRKDEEGKTLTVFKTNDKKYWTYDGMTLWTVWGEDSGAFKRRTVKTAKSDGYSAGGYGIVFCQGEHETDGKTVCAMLVVMINNEGQYILGKAYGGVFVDFGWWKTSPYLNRGTGKSNEITVDYDESKTEFVFYANGKEIERFRDEEEPALRNGKNGYIVVTTPFDNFPSTAVDVYFGEEI